MASTIDDLIDKTFSYDIDAEIAKISGRMRDCVRRDLRKRGLVVAISGGIDSSVSAALAAEAVGRDRVFGLLMPEKDSSPAALERGSALVEHLGIDHLVEDIAPTLDAIGCYRWRDEAIRHAFPDYGPGWKSKIAISGGKEGRYNHFRLIVEDPEGERHEARLGLREYLQIVAATNFKQRVRKTLEFFHADRLNYAVVGTPNRVEYDQGFFVKNGDGSADLKPIAHLYKVQVYMMASHIGLPDEICKATPTTDTYSLPQGQDEFYYALPFREMDVALQYRNEGRSAGELASALGLDERHAQLIFDDIDTTRRTTAPLHWPALLMEPVEGPMSKPG